MRLFIAINFDNTIKKYLKSVQTSTKSISASGNFSREENLHLTLVFLGEIVTSRINQIAKAMDSVTALAFEITLGGIGSFTRKDGHIVWVGVKQNETLTSIYNQLCSSLNEGSFLLENGDYKPHLTLARKVMLTGSLNSLSVPDITTKIDRISLMKSERIGSKLVYTEIYVTELS